MPAQRLRSSAGGSGPVSPGAMGRCVHLSSAGMPTPIRPQGDVRDMRSTPHNITTSTVPFEPVAGPFWRPKSLLRRADKPLSRCLWLAWRSGDLRDPLGECRRDANSLAPNGSKARTLRCARQELVRVPESNTKYGGLWGITGGKPAPVVEASISESSGIPNRKNLHPVVFRTLPPALHRAGIFLADGVAQGGLT